MSETIDEAAGNERIARFCGWRFNQDRPGDGWNRGKVVGDALLITLADVRAEPPDYFRSGDAMLELLEALRTKGYGCNLSCHPRDEDGEPYGATVSENQGDVGAEYSGPREYGEKLPEAVAKATIRLLDAIDGESV